jgi:hydrogenase expression/formation protein HypE
MKEKIMLGHGSGGLMSRRLIRELILGHLGNPLLDILDDAALADLGGSKVAFTTDSYVVRPLFFPGGDIGKLSVCGTVNDLAVMGARPRLISLGLILEEGFPLEDLDKILASIRRTADEASVQVATGDTKVVERGAADGLFINTAGIGTFEEGGDLSGRKIREGDMLLLNGTIGDHGAAIFSARQEMRLSSTLASDCAPLNGLIASVLAETGGVRFMRDPTRGGLAAVLNEIAADTGLGVTIDEKEIPVREEVRAICDLVGFDPLHLANEGKALLVVSPEEAQAALTALRRHPLGERASIIGSITASSPGKVILKTTSGGKRILDLPESDPLPRIC